MTDDRIITLPLPRDPWGAGVVISAYWINRHSAQGDLTYVVLIMDPEPGRFSVIHFNATQFRTTATEGFYEILPAVLAYFRALPPGVGIPNPVGGNYEVS